MRRSLLLLTLPALTLAAAVPAPAAIPHTVAPGETLWQLAAANNMTTRSFAAANGLSETANVVAGTTIQIPSVAEASAALTRIGITPAVPTTAPAAAAAAPAPAAAAPATGAPPALGGYTVRPGDTLSGLAAGARIPLAQMAAMNGLDPNHPLLIGPVLKLPTGAPAPVRAAQPAPAKVVPAASPMPVPGRVTS